MPKRKVHILIVEDSEDDAETMSLELMRRNGFDVTYDRVWDEAGMRKAFETKQYNAVWCDYNMPGFSAERAMQILKEFELSIPFILLSGVVSDETANRMIRGGASDYIPKSIIAKLVPVMVRELELAESNEELLDIIQTALQYRDWATEGHSKRVTDLTVQLARAMEISEVHITHMRIGALLHDVGKIGITDKILLKRDQLTPGEWTEMQRHPQLAYDLLKRAKFLKPSLDIPYCHHERWDGSGYPRQLKGEEIPLGARIFAVVDVWDALTTDRPYREAWSVVKTLAYIRVERGRLFDPQVVDAFVTMMEQL